MTALDWLYNYKSVMCVCVYWLLVLSDVPPLFLECICGIEKWQDLIFCSTINMTKKNTATK